MESWADAMPGSYNSPVVRQGSTLAACALAAAIGAVSALVAAQGPADDARALSDRAAARIKALRQEVDRLAAAARSVFNDLRRLELERAIAEQQVAEADARLAAVT